MMKTMAGTPACWILQQSFPSSSNGAITQAESTFCPKVFRVNFWMKHYGHGTFKRTSILTNDPRMEALDRGRLNRSMTKCHYKTTDQYVDAKTGQKKFKGRKELKVSQSLASKYYVSAPSPHHLFYLSPRQGLTQSDLHELSLASSTRFRRTRSLFRQRPGLPSIIRFECSSPWGFSYLIKVFWVWFLAS